MRALLRDLGLDAVDVISNQLAHPLMSTCFIMCELLGDRTCLFLTRVQGNTPAARDQFSYVLRVQDACGIDTRKRERAQSPEGIKLALDVLDVRAGTSKHSLVETERQTRQPPQIAPPRSECRREIRVLQSPERGLDSAESQRRLKRADLRTRHGVPLRRHRGGIHQRATHVEMPEIRHSDVDVSIMDTLSL